MFRDIHKINNIVEMKTVAKIYNVIPGYAWSKLPKNILINQTNRKQSSSDNFVILLILNFLGGGKLNVYNMTTTCTCMHVFVNGKNIKECN